jgi:hypothetical protein
MNKLASTEICLRNAVYSAARNVFVNFMHNLTVYLIGRQKGNKYTGLTGCQQNNTLLYSFMSIITLSFVTLQIRI